ncbi:MAG: protein-L-isoaspartate(D-aspartate) O-methyltransferase [Thermoleophilia bacterium]|nr:protein-L-isoaspartate(D-aspartate) O-methyltransferase [Thermoleophilia bacterium]
MATSTQPHPLRQAAIRGGTRDARVLAALERVDRAAFVPAHARARARVHEDAPIDIGRGQTTSQPSLVARILDDLHVLPGARVLEVGTGLGYEAMLAGMLAAPRGSVVTIERDPVLALDARERIEAACAQPGFEHVDIEVRVGDGSLGAPDRAPYDAVIVAATATSVPPALETQLADLGRLIIPIRTDHGTELLRFDRHGSRIVPAGTLGLVRYVPLVPGVAGESAEPGADPR